jgi:hypothetical protein
MLYFLLPQTDIQSEYYEEILINNLVRAQKLYIEHIPQPGET